MSRIPRKLEDKIRKDAKYRCGYCRLSQNLIPNMLEIEHLFPLAKGGESVEENLWLACRNCNSFKSSKIDVVDPETNKIVLLFNPRKQDWNKHFEFNQEGIEIIGKTPCGRATVAALNLNFEQALTARKNWVSVGWYPPKV